MVDWDKSLNLAPGHLGTWARVKARDSSSALEPGENIIRCDRLLLMLDISHYFVQVERIFLPIMKDATLVQEFEYPFPGYFAHESADPG